MKAAIYNPYLDTLGGGERYTVGVIKAFAKKNYKVYVEWKNKEILEKLSKRFGIDMDNVSVVDSISRGDGYDACFWVSDGSVPTLRSRNNIVHFQVPFTDTKGKSLMNRMKFFRIKTVVTNSNFTKGFIDTAYGVNSKTIYPPVSVNEFKPKRKQNVICYVGRFSELTQHKRQDVLIEVFKAFYKKNKSWKLVLAGGVEVGNNGLTDKLEKLAKGYPVEVLESPSFAEVKTLMGLSKMFWSASGYGVDENINPKKVEHFGITVVEAMAAKAIPLVINKGGHKEIVSDGTDGYLWNKKSELLEVAERLSSDATLVREVSIKAQHKSKEFSDERFSESFSEII